MLEDAIDIASVLVDPFAENMEDARELATEALSSCEGGVTTAALCGEAVLDVDEAGVVGEGYEPRL